MSLIPLKNRLSSPSHIYYDIQVFNKRSSEGPALQLEFNESRNSAFVNKASDYELSIIRFQTDTTSLPSYFVQIQPNQSNINLTVYSITVELTNRTTGAFVSRDQQFIIWNPENEDAPLPIPPNQTQNLEQDDSTDYYYGNSMPHLVGLIKNAVNTALTALGQSGSDIILYWNTSSAKLEIYGFESRLGEALLSTNKTSLYFNRELQSLFSGMVYERYINATNGKYYRLVFSDTIKNRETLIGSTYIKNEQEFSTISNISPVSSIVFTTSTLPIVANQLSSPIISVNGQLVGASSNSNFLSIISDLQVNDQFYKPNILYNPSAEYRFLDLISSQPINNIDIRCWWKTKTGNFKPFYLFSGMSATMKLLFRKKETDYILATAEQNL